MSKKNKIIFTSDGLQIFVLTGKRHFYNKIKIMHRPFATYFTQTHAMLWMCMILIGSKELCVES